MKYYLYYFFFGTFLAIFPTIAGCDGDNTQKRLEDSQNDIADRLKARYLIPSEREFCKILYTSLQASTVKSLETPTVVYAELRVMEKRMALKIDWIAKTPTIDSVRVECNRGKYTQLFPIEKWEQEALFREAKKWVGYNVGIFFEKGNSDGKKIFDLLQKEEEVTASLMFNGKVISNKLPIKINYSYQKKTTSGKAG